MKKNILTGLLALFILGWQTTAQAIVLDWTSYNYSSGSLDQSFNVSGVTVRIQISGDTSRLDSGYPDDNTDLTGGFGSSTESLKLRADFASKTESLTVTVSFSVSQTGYNGVDNVSFMIFDIDKATYDDQIKNISAKYGTGSSYAASSITGSSANVVTNAGLSSTITGISSVNDATGTGNATIGFGTNALTSFTFTWANDPSTQSDPTVQHIGFYGLTFSKHTVPEVNPAAGAMAICGLMLLGRRLRFFRRA